MSSAGESLGTDRQLSTLNIDKQVDFLRLVLPSPHLCCPRFMRNESMKAQSDSRLKRKNSEGQNLSFGVGLVALLCSTEISSPEPSMPQRATWRCSKAIFLCGGMHGAAEAQLRAEGSLDLRQEVGGGCVCVSNIRHSKRPVIMNGC